MITCSIYDATRRLTGSLALSIAYGIQADTPDNEFFRMFTEMMDAMSEALVPGAFFVDIFPLRESNHLSTVRSRALTKDDLRQSRICLLGSQVYGSMRMQKKLSRTCTRLRPVR